MYSNSSNQVSSLGRVLCITWIAFSTFAIGYTLSRVLLGQSVSDTDTAEIVIPHQATLWDAGLSQ